MLLGNSNVLHRVVGRLVGTVVGAEHGNYGKGGGNRARFTGLFDPTGTGHYPPAEFILPTTAGGMSSINMTTLGVDASGSGRLGVNIQGAAALQLLAAALGRLIVSGSGAASFSMAADATVVATLGASGGATISLSAAAILGAIANVQGSTTVSLTAGAQLRGKGFMQGHADLAGSAVASPFDEVIEGDFTAKQILRVVLAALAGKSSGVGTNTESYFAKDGVTPRITTSFDQTSNRVTVTLDGD